MARRRIRPCARLAAHHAGRRHRITTISAVFFGLLIGFVLSPFWQRAMIVLEYRRTAAGAGFAPVHHPDRLLPGGVDAAANQGRLRFLIPYVEFSKQLCAQTARCHEASHNDGRIADICDTGIIDSKLVVPPKAAGAARIADSSDKVLRPAGARHPEADAVESEDRGPASRRQPVSGDVRRWTNARGARQAALAGWRRTTST